MRTSKKRESKRRKKRRKVSGMIWSLMRIKSESLHLKNDTILSKLSLFARLIKFNALTFIGFVA
jgi:hypothetical protein